MLYVGEAKDLIARLKQEYPSIPDWDYYRYEALPEELEPYRVELERMVIRALAALLPNKKNVPSLEISDFRLANEKIDK